VTEATENYETYSGHIKEGKEDKAF